MSKAFPSLDLSHGIDPDRFASLVPGVEGMRACIQDPVFHAEGDVWTHTLMVAEALANDPAFAILPDARREALSWAVLFHDVEKPATRTVEHDMDLGRERVSHPHHAPRGARTAWGQLWRMGAPLELRQDVFSLCAGHQRPFHLLSSPRWQEEIVRFSISGRWHDLVLLALADNRGRVCPDAKATEQTLSLVHMAAEDMGCLERPYPFPSEQALVRFSRTRDATFHYDPPKPRGSRVIVLSGFPGVGKSTYARESFPDLPQVCLDDIRARMKVEYGKREGQVSQAALEEARKHLRAGLPFVWNATNLTRLARDKIIGLSLEYDAYVEIHALEAPHALVMTRNANRRQSVPKDAMEGFIAKWDPPRPGEAHAIVHVDTAPAPRTRQTP